MGVPSPPLLQPHPHPRLWRPRFPHSQAARELQRLMVHLSVGVEHPLHVGRVSADLLHHVLLRVQGGSPGPVSGSKRRTDRWLPVRT